MLAKIADLTYGIQHAKVHRKLLLYVISMNRPIKQTVLGAPQVLSCYLS